jgi:hypothetical protein
LAATIWRAEFEQAISPVVQTTRLIVENTMRDHATCKIDESFIVAEFLVTLFQLRKKVQLVSITLRVSIVHHGLLLG